jgi:DNA mismatch repair protein MutS
MIFDEYAAYTAKYTLEFGPKTLILIEIGSFWEFYDDEKGSGANMKAVSDVLNIQVTRKNKKIADISRNNPYMAGFPSHVLDKFLSLLVNDGYTVVLVGQITAPPNPKRGVTKIVSQGTYIPDSMSNSGNYVASIYVEKGIVGASVADLSTGKTAVFENENDKTSLEKFLITYDPCQVWIYGAAPDEVFKGINPKAKIHHHGGHEVKATPAFQNEILSLCFENDTMLSAIEFVNMERYTIALVAFVALLVNIRKQNERICTNLVKPILFENDMMELVGNAAQQLDLPGVETLLNKCVTAIGRRCFKHRLLNPFKSTESIKASHIEIDKWITHSEDRDHMRKQVLGKLYDLERLFRRVKIGTINLDGLALIESTLSHLVAYCPEAKEIWQQCFRGAFENGSFCAGYDSDLDALNRELLEIANRKNDLEASLNAKTSWNLVIDDEHFTISTTCKRWKDGQADLFKGFHASHASSASVVKIINPELESLSNRKMAAESELVSAKANVLVKLTSALIEQHGVLCDAVCNFIGETDFYSTCAENAVAMGHCKPEVGSDSCGFKITGLRHPLIERMQHKCRYVPNDVEMQESGILLYGLNASGKSSLMKALGLAVIMAQCGMYVACTSMILNAPFQHVFCRISKGDDIYNSQSTFMVEMSELRTILQRANKMSLVLGDELCAGTEHISAISIVAAGIRALIHKQSTFVFTTHLHELVQYIDYTPKQLAIYHLDVYFDRSMDALVFNRLLKPGQGSKIYGLEVCQSLDLEKDFIEDAFNIRNKITTGIKKSRYNSKVFVSDKCYMCNNKHSLEVHHIVEQKYADAHGLIHGKGVFHKNAKHNLVSLCEECHKNVHHGDLQIDGFVDTSKGARLKFGLKK